MEFSIYFQYLKEFVGFKSISTDPQYKSEIVMCANWIKDLLNQYGVNSKIIEGKITNPYVFGEYKVSESAETILIYGHYDVQPADISDGWNSEPFDLIQKDNRIFGRGSVDNKGQILIHIFTVGELIKQNKLKYNVKFLIEGNEETGNDEISGIIREYKDLFTCDYILISDGEIVADSPTIDVSFRGGNNVNIKVKTANNNVHSGIYGGAVPSATFELINLLNKLYDSENKVAIPGFYKDVLEPTPEEIENNKSVPFSMNELTNITGIKSLKLEKGFDYHTQIGLRPMLTVTGFKSGYTDTGFNNIVPATAEAKINFRFVANQDPKEMYELFKKFAADNLPDYVDYEITRADYWKAIKVDTSTPKFKEVSALLENIYSKKPILHFVGASIPIIVDFKEVLGKDTISISLANEDCNMHGANENFRVDLIEKGLEFSKRFFGL